MEKLMGKKHRPNCDCDSPHVNSTSEKCNKKHGSKRTRKREKETWRKDELEK